jgi:Txe/YoeB family toxin of Txe-Axe toxin-antitoxin module
MMKDPLQSSQWNNYAPDPGWTDMKKEIQQPTPFITSEQFPLVEQAEKMKGADRGTFSRRPSNAPRS